MTDDLTASPTEHSNLLAAAVRGRPWWRDAVMLQVYPRSYADADGDGVGDLPGVISKLDYIAALGVDGVWLSPFYRSPMNDAGYDVADYRDVDPLFGNLADAQALIDGCHARSIKIVVDLVPNHSSSEHDWFKAAIASPPGSPEWERYILRRGQGVTGSQPPNDWNSVFHGAAWTQLQGGGSAQDGEPLGWWYLHLFDDTQPDFNWQNPQVREEFHAILRYWLDRGVDGFRIDVAHGLVKDADFPDMGSQRTTFTAEAWLAPYWDQPGVHEIYRGWRQVLDAYRPDRTLVAEAYVSSPKRLAAYLRPDELHTAFNFAHLRAEWTAQAQRKVIVDSLHAVAEVGAPSTWVLSNHDVIRHVTRYSVPQDGTRAAPRNGDLELGRRRARAAILLMLSLPGGVYLYQGEELGLEEVIDLPAACRQDPVFRRTNGEWLGRDGCRVPIPWSGSEPPFGFGPGRVQPWLPQPTSWRSLTVEAQAIDPQSMLRVYRRALTIRKTAAWAGDGGLAWRDELPGATADVLVWARAADGSAPVVAGDDYLRCAVNAGAVDVALELGTDWELLLGSLPEVTLDVSGLLTLPSDSAAWLIHRG